MSRAQLHLLHDLPVGTRGLLCSPPEAVSPPLWTDPVPTASLQWICVHLIAHHPCRAFPTELPSHAVPAWITARGMPSWGEHFVCAFTEFQKIPTSPVSPACLRFLWMAALTLSILLVPKSQSRCGWNELWRLYSPTPMLKDRLATASLSGLCLVEFLFLSPRMELYSLLGNLFQCSIILTVRKFFLMV